MFRPIHAVFGAAALLAMTLTVMMQASAGAAVLRFVVTNTNDSGPGSLRQAMLDVNGTATDEIRLIEFDIPRAGPLTIAELRASVPHPAGDDRRLPRREPGPTRTHRVSAAGESGRRIRRQRAGRPAISFVSHFPSEALQG